MRRFGGASFLRFGALNGIILYYFPHGGGRHDCKGERYGVYPERAV